MDKYDVNNYFWNDFEILPNNPYLIHVDYKKFKCLFVHFTKDKEYSKSDYPIAFGYMASLLRMNGGNANIEVLCIDQYFPELFAKYDLICFFPMSVLLKQLLNITLTIKHNYPAVNICLFNSEQHQHEMPLCAPMAASFGRSIMEEYSSIDFILLGEAEKTFLELCKKLVAKNNDFTELPSCLYRNASTIMLSEKGIVPIDFQYLPFPSRDFLEESMSSEGINRYSPRIQSSRGCISRCLYCVESAANITDRGRKKPWIGRDILRFVDEIEMIAKRYGVVFFNIIDSSFEDPGKRGLERIKIFCKEIINREINASFKAHFRMETFDKLEDAFLELIKKAGVDILIVGAESGLDNELQSYKKITSARKNINNIHRLKDYGKFFILLGHMMFSPCLKLDDMPKKIKFLREIKNGWDYLNISNNLLTFRGTAYHDLIQKRSLALETEKLSTVIPYRYSDYRIKLLADEIGSLRTKCPEVILLHNSLYDALNISARYSNKMNSHLWNKEYLFNQFRNALDNLLRQIQEVYCGYFLELIELVAVDSNAEEMNQVYRKWIPGTIHGFLRRSVALIDTFIKACEDDGLSTAKLYLKTWMSLINKETNTSGGKVEA